MIIKTINIIIRMFTLKNDEVYIILTENIVWNNTLMNKNLKGGNIK